MGYLEYETPKKAGWVRGCLLAILIAVVSLLVLAAVLRFVYPDHWFWAG